jgi:hypothetical protein
LFDKCLAYFSRITLLRLQEKSGPLAKPRELATALGVSAESVLLAIAFQKRTGIIPCLPAKKAISVFSSDPCDDDDNDQEAGSIKTNPGCDPGRFLRERTRSVLIAMLTPGMVLRSTCKGERFETLVMVDHYVVLGIKYPTLYAAMVSITGTRPYPKQLLDDGTRPPGTREMTKMSAVRYYGLKRKFEPRKKQEESI